MAVYPNPAKDKLYIDGITGYRTIEIANANGKIIQKLNVSPSLKYINIGQLTAGMYLLTVSSDKETQTIKFIRN